MNSIVSYRDVDVSLLFFNKAENVGKNGSKVIYIGGVNLVQSPRCRLPFDPFTNSFTVNLGEQFYHIIRDIEGVVIAEAIRKSKEWFGIQLGENVIKGMFKSVIMESNKGYLPSMKIAYNEECEFFNWDNTIAERTKLVKGSEVRLLLSFPKVNVKKRSGVTTFNITCELYQLKFAKQAASEEASEAANQDFFKTYSFIDDK